MKQSVFDMSRWLISAIARGLRKRGDEGVEEVLARLAQQSLGEQHFNPLQPHRLPVMRFLPECTAQSILVDADVAAALAAIEEHLNWRQSASYNDAVLGEGFMDNYGWCELIGSEGFFPGDDFRLGFLMLGPHRHYSDHYHPAPELYWPLTGPSDWKKGAGGFETRQAGEVIWHPPLRVHATKTGNTPLLALWSWTREAGTPASLVTS